MTCMQQRQRRWECRRCCQPGRCTLNVGHLELGVTGTCHRVARTTLLVPECPTAKSSWPSSLFTSACAGAIRMPPCPPAPSPVPGRGPRAAAPQPAGTPLALRARNRPTAAPPVEWGRCTGSAAWHSFLQGPVLSLHRFKEHMERCVRCTGVHRHWTGVCGPISHN